MGSKRTGQKADKRKAGGTQEAGEPVNTPGESVGTDNSSEGIGGHESGNAVDASNGEWAEPPHPASQQENSGAIAEAAKQVAKVTLYRAFKDARYAVAGMRDIPEEVVTTVFVNLFPEILLPQAKIFAAKLTKAEMAVIIATFYHGFHVGYGSHIADTQTNRNLHSEIQ